MIPTEYTRNLDEEKFHVLSIPNFVIKKDRRHGARHDKSEAQREYHQAKGVFKESAQGKVRLNPSAFSTVRTFTEFRRRMSDGMKNSANVLTGLHSKIIHMYLLGMSGNGRRRLGI